MSALRWTALAALLVAMALVTPFNHDETQYYAAAKLAPTGLPYRDYIYLQTPLFAWWGGLLSILTPGFLLLAGRLSQALLGLAVLVLTYRTALRATGDRGRALAAAILVAASYPFLFSTTVFRNDMLPMVLEALALAVLLPLAARRTGSGPGTAFEAAHPALRLFAGGLLIGLAASAKVNFILLGGAPALWLLLQRGIPAGRKIALLAALAAGGLAGVLPIVLAVLPAPQEALWQIVTFGSEAPHEWYCLTGQDWRLTPWGRALDALVVLIQGPALLVLILAVRARIRGTTRPTAQDTLLDLFVLAALAASLVPAPVWRQYFVVLLPPLALRMAMLWPVIGESRALRTAFIVFCLVGTAFGMGRSLSGLARLPDTIVAREIAAHRLGERLAGAGPVATLAPEYAIDSGAPLDRAFAPGPFVYRWSRSSAFGAVNADSLTAHFAANPPAAIVTGQESDDEDPRRDLDRELRRWAETNGYTPVPAGDGETTFYLAPLVEGTRGS